MNILIFSPVNIYPADAGSRVRIYNLTDHLIQLGHKIHFVYYTQNGVDKLHFDFMQEMCETFTVIVKKIKVAQKEGNYVLDEWYEDSIHLKVNEIVALFDIDIVLSNYIFHSKFLDFLPEHIVKIIDTHDKFTNRYKLFSDKKGIKYTWHSYSKDDEAKALNRADMVIAITDEEKRYFSSICNSKVVTIGHIEDKKDLNISYNKLERIGFIGGPNRVNAVAINDFLETFYQNSKNAKNLKIIIAGRICKHITYQHKNIELLGLVDDLEAFYKNIDLIVNPLTFGTGQKIKSIEALSYGKPIISTKVGFEGIHSHEDFHHLNSLNDMVKKIDEIAQQPKQLLTMEKSSKNIFNRYYEQLEKDIESLFENKKSAKNLLNVDKNILIKYQQKTQIEQAEIIIKNYQAKIRKQRQKTKKYEALLKAIKDVTQVSFALQPFKKYKLYKNILKAYHAKY